MKSRFWTIFCLCFLFSTVVLASSATISASKDVFVRQGNGTNYNDPYIVVKNENGGRGANVRKGIIQFQFNPLPGIDDAKLLLDVTHVLQPETYYVWGVKDGSSFEDFDEQTTVDADWNGILDRSSDGTSNNINYLYDSNPNKWGAQALGQLHINTSDLGKTVIFDQPHLKRFLENDTNGIATIILTRLTQSSAGSSFAAFEHETAMEPRLFISVPDQTVSAAADTYVRYSYNASFGSEPYIHAKHHESTTAHTNRKGIIAFDLGAVHSVKDASLALDVAVFNNGNAATFHLWAIADQSPYESVDIESLHMSDMNGVFDTSYDGVANHSRDLYNNGHAIARFDVDAGDLYQTITLPGGHLTDLVNNDSNGRIVLLLTRLTANGHMNTGFASTEHPTLQGPRLILRPEIDKYTSQVDFEVLTADADGDNYGEMVLVVNTPDGGGYTTADPWVMADFFYSSDYGFGLDYDFYEALSPTQQDTFQLQFANATTTVNLCIEEHANLPIASLDIATYFDGLDKERQYNLETFKERFNLEAKIADGEVDLSASIDPCTLLDLRAGAFFGTVQTASAQAAFTLKKGELAMGAEASAYTVSVGVQSDSGSYGSISYSAGGGIFVSLVANEGGVGATFPFLFNTTVSFYLTAEDAASIEAALRQGLTDEFYDNLDFVPVTLFAVNDRTQRFSVFLERKDNDMSILVQDSGSMSLIILENVNQYTINKTINTIEDVSKDDSSDDKSELFNNSAGTWDEVVEILTDIAAITDAIADAFEDVVGFIGSLFGS